MNEGDRLEGVVFEASPFCSELNIRYGVVVHYSWLDNSYYDLLVKRPLTI